CMQGIQFPFTC
nr:immunoglobulin light chain junction region [Macaca mulatta]MPN88309.1 immunoglobulin light chain junction region [Macaca mulatta]MPN90060.1 immunoglobulin light chain junction region [Macaca mulatta]